MFYIYIELDTKIQSSANMYYYKSKLPLLTDNIFFIADKLEPMDAASSGLKYADLL